MKNRSTLIATILLLGLGSWYYFYEVKGQAARDQASQDSKIIFKNFDATALQEILLHEGGEDIALKKIGTTWTMTNPVQANVDSSSMDALLDALKGVQKEDVVDESGSSLAAFGLQNPQASASFSSGPNNSKAILFGVDSPTGEYTYAQVQGEGPVFMVMHTSKVNIIKSSTELRDKKVLDFQPAQVQSLKSSIGKGLALEMDKTGQWNLTAPFKNPGNHDAILSWLQQLATLRIESFIDEHGKNLDKYGLLAPAAKIQIGISGQPKPIVLYQGKKVPGKNMGSYYRVEGKPLVFTLADYISSTLDKKAEELADRQAFQFNPGDVLSFDVTRSGKTLHAVKKDNVWAWDPALPATPGQAPFDFETFLSDVSSAKLMLRLPKETKIPNPSMVITFRGQEDAALEKITVGSDGKLGQMVLSMAKDQAVEVSESLFGKLPQ
jgi:hypothetical protein